MVGSMSVPICNHFHVRRANTGKITSFYKGCPSFAPLFVGTPLTQGHEILPEILETLGYYMMKTRSLYLIWAWNGTGMWHQDKQTDRQTDRITIANMRYNMLALAHKNYDLRNWTLDTQQVIINNWLGVHCVHVHTMYKESYKTLFLFSVFCTKINYLTLFNLHNTLHLLLIYLSKLHLSILLNERNDENPNKFQSLVSGGSGNLWFHID